MTQRPQHPPRRPRAVVALLVALGHPPRRYANFLAAADEAAVSRLYGGIHFPTGNAAGRVLGDCVGRAVAARGIGVIE